MITFTIRDLSLDGTAGMLTMSQDINGQARVLDKWVRLRVRPAPRVKVGRLSVGVPEGLWNHLANRVLAIDVARNWNKVKV